MILMTSLIQKGEPLSMPDLEDRVSKLERKVAMLELLRVRDEREAEDRIPPVQMQNLRDVNETISILLGIVSSQDMDIKTMRESLADVKNDLGDVEHRLGRLETKVDENTALLIQILERLSGKS
jgi:uncharacterized protein with PhoU and TrkA domain